ncbi:hypothetical protein QCQ60_004518 [Bacillus cereus]|nr:hypothetical protein [Bacillus cereus]
MNSNYPDQYLKNMLEEISKIRSRNTERLFYEINSFIFESLTILAMEKEITDKDFRRYFIELIPHINKRINDNIYTTDVKEDLKRQKTFLSEVTSRGLHTKKTFGYLLSNLANMKMKDIRLLIACISKIDSSQVCSVVSIEEYTNIFNLNENRYEEFKEACESIKNFQITVVFQNTVTPIKFNFFDSLIYVEDAEIIINNRFVEYKITEGRDSILRMILELFSDAVSVAYSYGYELSKTQISFFKRIYLGRR